MPSRARQRARTPTPQPDTPSNTARALRAARRATRQARDDETTELHREPTLAAPEPSQNSICVPSIGLPSQAAIFTLLVITDI